MFINHCHVFPEEHQYGEVKPPVKGTIKNLLRIMEELGIAKVVVFPPYEGIEMDSDPNEWLLEQIKDYPQLVGFINIDPRSVDAPERIERYVSRGLKGIKFHPAILKCGILEEGLEKFYKKAQEKKIPIVYHTGAHGWKLMRYRPILIDEVAQDYPDLPIILEHCGGQAFYYQALAVLQNNRNVYAGISTTITPNASACSWWHLGIEKIKQIISMVGPERVIYGMDFPWNRPADTKEEIKIIRQDLGIDAEAQELILGKNLEKLLTT